MIQKVGFGLSFAKFRDAVKEFKSHLFHTKISHHIDASALDIKTRKLVIIGSGPAGYTAAIYAARANLEPIVYEGSYAKPAREGYPGGQLMTTTDVENYPGFPTGVNGPELVLNMREQAERFGAKLIEEDVVQVDLQQYPFVVKTGKTIEKALAIIVATGARGNYPDIPGTREGEFWQKGVSSCAVCDGALPLFRNKQLYVIGGGDSAAEEALFLSKFASKVFLVHRRDQLRASKIMQERVLANPKIEVVWDSVITKVDGDEVVKNVVVKNVKTGKEEVRDAAGVFFGTGHTPNTAFLNGQLALKNGYISVTPGTSMTSVPKVFAAGDVQDPRYKQAITSAASGCMAALDAERALAV